MPQMLRRKLLIIPAIVAIVSLFLSVLPASAWWDGKWQYRKKILFDTTPKGADLKEAVAEAPVLVRLHGGNFSFANAKKDGADIRFVSGDDKMPLKFHLEKFDAAEEIALIWVKIPRLPAASNQEFIWLYYGNSNASSGQETGATYDTSQLAVYHLGEKEGPPKDSTAYNNHAKEFFGKQGIPSVIGTGMSFKGEGDRIAIAKSPSLNFSKGFTFSGWLRLSGTQKDAHLLSWDDGSQSIVIGIDGTKLYGSFGSGKTKTRTDKPVDLPSQKWVHIAVAAEPGKVLTLYLDGQEKGSMKMPAALPEPKGDLALGGSIRGGNTFSGDIDEIQIAGTVRSASWIRAAAKAQGPDSLFMNFLDEESPKVSGSEGLGLTIHLLVVVAKTISLDGWIIIGILVIMSALTWIVFFNKTIYLRRIKRENAAFATAFTRTRSVLEMKEAEDQYPNASMFRVYSGAAEELERRLENAHESGGKKSLAAEAKTIIRSALDKGSLQESKKNTGGLIILTMGISGGPFLGLLGTVWGVMNTFAGVAEAGEASLAAIAPGVASALACTLAGLVVAIPALFAYSYLSSEIKNLAAEMNVFMDEFMMRVDEGFGRGHE